MVESSGQRGGWVSSEDVFPNGWKIRMDLQGINSTQPTLQQEDEQSSTDKTATEDYTTSYSGCTWNSKSGVV